MDKLEFVLAILGVVLGIGALAVGIYHVREIRLVLSSAKSQLDSLAGLQRDTATQLEGLKTIQQSTKSQLEKLETIRGSISTRYLSEFPDFIPDIVKLISEARSRVNIFCDIPAYGQFTSRADWIKYSHAIEDLDKNVEVNLICLDPDKRVAFYHEQFLQELPWQKWKHRQPNRQRLEELLSVKKSEIKLEALEESEFVRLLEDTNDIMLRGSLSRARRHEIEFFMPIYFWLVDGIKAIFSVPAFSKGHTEYGFITTDQTLISALNEMRERYERRPAPHPEPAGAPTTKHADELKGN